MKKLIFEENVVPSFRVAFDPAGLLLFFSFGDEDMVRIGTKRVITLLVIFTLPLQLKLSLDGRWRGKQFHNYKQQPRAKILGLYYFASCRSDKRKTYLDINWSKA